MLTALALSLALTQTPLAEQAVSLPITTGMLQGSLIQAGPDAPAAVMISGSGPTDRNGDNPAYGHPGYLGDLAQGLAEAGITTVRYDKRGVGASAAALGDPRAITFADMVSDARDWAAWLRAETGQDCVWLIGHSEGALVAQSAAVGDPGICGLVLISGSGRPAGVLIREQLAAVPEPLKSQAFGLLGEMEAGREVDCPPTLVTLCAPAVQPYLISWLLIDPSTLAATETRPMLILQGLTDLQTSETDARALWGANEAAELVLLDGVNHLLRAAPMDRAANLATYADPDLPLDSRVVPTVADFVLTPR